MRQPLLQVEPEQRDGRRSGRATRRLLAAIVAGALSVGLVGAPAGLADQRVASYCSATGDFCQAIVRKSSGGYDFRLTTFSFRGNVLACVSRLSRVCRGSPLRLTRGDLYQTIHHWELSYPNQGPGRYSVTWSWNGTKVGRTLYFTRAAGAVLNCGRVSYRPGPDYEGDVEIRQATGVNCTQARSVVRACAFNPTVAGWQATGTAGQFTLSSGTRRIVVRGVAGGPPRCAPAA